MDKLESLTKTLLEMKLHNGFDIMVEKMRRKAEKGLLEGISAEDINNALKKIENNINEGADFLDNDQELDFLIQETEQAVRSFGGVFNSECLAEALETRLKKGVTPKLDDMTITENDILSIKETVATLSEEQLDAIATDGTYLSEAVEKAFDLLIDDILTESEVESIAELESLNEAIILEIDGKNFGEKAKNAFATAGTALASAGKSTGSAIAGAAKSFGKGVYETGKTFASNLKNGPGVIAGIGNIWNGVKSTLLANPAGLLGLAGGWAAGKLIKAIINRIKKKREEKRLEKLRQEYAERGGFNLALGDESNQQPQEALTEEKIFDTTLSKLFL